MTELETKIWNIVHNWCDEQLNEIPDQNRRYLMDEMKALVLSHATVQSGKCTGCEESKGETKMWCCNHCGRRIEDF